MVNAVASGAVGCMAGVVGVNGRGVARALVVGDELFAELTRPGVPMS